MIYILILTTLIIFVFNLIITNNDFMHPSTIFSLSFLLYETVCMLGQRAYAVDININTVMVLLCGLIVFTVVAFVNNAVQKKEYAIGEGNRISNEAIKCKKINIHDAWVVLLIGVQLITIIYFIKYLKQISITYDGAQRGLSDLISLYDIMTKFWTDIFAGLNVPVPMLYRIGNPLSSAGAYLILYVLVNNYVAEKKINILHVIVVGLMCVLIVLNGSRSPLFRVITMMLILFYILNYKRQNKKVNLTFVMKLCGLLLVVGSLFVVMLFAMGRSGKLPKLGEYLFIYLGAPIANLNNFLEAGDFTPFSELFGAQTFKPLYAYAGKIMGIGEFYYDGINQFAFSDNGIEIGNVYTTYYNFIYDFGYLGVLPMILIIAGFYVLVYDRLCAVRKQKSVIDFGLFIYAYLFNDLIMLAFSSRFYETILDAPFIKLIIFAFVFDIFLFERKIKIGKKIITW